MSFIGLRTNGLSVKAGVEATGGAWHQAAGLSVPSLTGTFKSTFDDFRSSYMLRYTPQGVTRSGWHTIDVTVPGRRSLDVNARRGYGVEEVIPPIPTPVPAPNARLRTLPELTAAFERGALAQVQDSLRRQRGAAAACSRTSRRKGIRGRDRRGSRRRLRSRWWSRWCFPRARSTATAAQAFLGPVLVPRAPSARPR